MAKKWVTPRRCERCLLKEETNYCFAQEWGKDDRGRMEFLLDCPKCGWTGRSFWDGKSGYPGLGIQK